MDIKVVTSYAKARKGVTSYANRGGSGHDEMGRLGEARGWGSKPNPFRMIGVSLAGDGEVVPL